MATRLPGKPLAEVMGRPLLSYLLERVKRAKQIDEVVVATTTNPLDVQIVELCKKEGISYFRGSEEDVLERYYQAAEAHGADAVVRITADCPLIDPEVIDRVVAAFLDSSHDYLSNTIERSYPRGLDVEAFTFEALEKAARFSSKPDEREHVTLHMYRHPDRFSIGSLKQKEDSSEYRLTVDTEEDFELVRKIFEELYPRKREFSLSDLLLLLKERPELARINAHVQQKVVES